MEERGVLGVRAEEWSREFCRAMGVEPWSHRLRRLLLLSPRDIEELPLLTLGSQFQGSNNNKIGKAATVDVFLAVKEIVKDHIEIDGEQKIVLENASGRKVSIVAAADPDLRIEEEVRR